MKIAIASKSIQKVRGISEAFREFFPEEHLSTESFAVESGVGIQPINDNVFIGAENRLEQLKKYNYKSDYNISCESGLLEQFGKWYNFQIVLIEKGDEKYFGISSGYEIPEKYVQKVIESELREVFDEIFDGKGGISVLTYDKTNRITLIKNATLMALSRFNWK